MPRVVFTNSHKMRQSGFTLIESTLVLLIMAILGTIVYTLINFNGIAKKTRDAQKAIDLKNIQTALELYYKDYQVYPLMSSWLNLAEPNNSLAKALVPSYLNYLPYVGPRDLTKPCENLKVPGYFYSTNNSGQSYVLTATLEFTGNNLSPCSSLTNWGKWSSVDWCSVTPEFDTYCYGVQNP